MGTLNFYYGTMGSGKTTLALQLAYVKDQAGLNGLALTTSDRNHNLIRSRIGIEREAVTIHKNTNLNELVLNHLPDLQGWVICEEAQFYTREQVLQLAKLADHTSLEIDAFGLLTDFTGEMFDGTKWFLAESDKTFQVHSHTICGMCAKENINKPATHNLRTVDGERQYDGDLVVVDNQQNVNYVAVCRAHFHNW